MQCLYKVCPLPLPLAPLPSPLSLLLLLPILPSSIHQNNHFHTRPSLVAYHSNTGKMSANKTSAVADEPIDVLVALQDKFDLLDMAGPVEAFTNALHDFKDPCK
jgi:hypothetical protein